MVRQGHHPHPGPCLDCESPPSPGEPGCLTRWFPGGSAPRTRLICWVNGHVHAVGTARGWASGDLSWSQVRGWLNCFPSVAFDLCHLPWAVCGSVSVGNRQQLWSCFPAKQRASHARSTGLTQSRQPASPDQLFRCKAQCAQAHGGGGGGENVTTKSYSRGGGIRPEGPCDARKTIWSGSAKTLGVKCPNMQDNF